MDTFDVNTLEVYIKKYKSNIVNKLDTLLLNDKTITNQCDDMCMVLDYSPKINKKTNYFPKYQIQYEKRHSEKKILNRNQALNLENRPEGNEEEEEEEEEEEGEEQKEQEEEIDKDLGRLANADNKPQANINFNSLNNNNQSQIENQEVNQTNEDANQESQEKDRYAYDMINDRYTLMNNKMKQNRLLLEGKIRVYVLNTEKFLEFEVNQEETFKQLKKKVLDKLESAANFSLEHHNIDSYEFKVVNEYNIVQFNEPPIDEAEIIMTKNEDTIAFLQKQQYVGFGRLTNQPNPVKLIGNVISSSEVDKINLKIFIKLDANNPSSKILQIASESTLKNVIESLSDKSRIPYKNPDLYYFVEHSNNSTASDDGEDAINVDIQLKSLNTFEIDVSNISYIYSFTVSLVIL